MTCKFITNRKLGEGGDVVKYFSMPADFKLETIDRYAELNRKYEDARIIETYGQITNNNFMESGRSSDQLPPVDLENLKLYIRHSQAHNIDFNYTINGSFMQNKELTPEGVAEIKGFLHQLYGLGVRSLTIALPTLLELVKSTGYDFKIKLSTISQVTTPNKARAFGKLGVEGIVVDESINRDFDKLTRIREAFGGRVEVIVNTVCHKDCINRMFHYNQIAGDSLGQPGKSSTTYYSNRCLLKRTEDPANFLRLNWIRPEDLKYYETRGINYFKLQGRQTVLQGDPVRAVEHYIQGAYAGNLLELLYLFSRTNPFLIYLDNQKLTDYLQPFLEKPGFCQNDCLRCGYCNKMIATCTELDQASQINSLAVRYVNKFDEYKKILREK